MSFSTVFTICLSWYVDSKQFNIFGVYGFLGNYVSFILCSFLSGLFSVIKIYLTIFFLFCFVLFFCFLFFGLFFFQFPPVFKNHRWFFLSLSWIKVPLALKLILWAKFLNATFGLINHCNFLSLSQKLLGTM